jgi:hypothetical protein
MDTRKVAKELGLVEMLRDILYFREELEKWVLSNEKL